MTELSAKTRESISSAYEPQSPSIKNALGSISITAAPETANTNTEDPTQSNALTYTIYTIGAIATIIWIAFCISYAFENPIDASPSALGAYLTGIFAPPALFWMLIGSLQRRIDIDTLRNEMKHATPAAIPSPTESRKAIQDAHALKNAADASLQSLKRLRSEIQKEISELSSVTQKADLSSKQISQILTARTENLASLTQEIEQRLSTIDATTQKGVESWDAAALHILERSAEMENAITVGAEKIIGATDTAEAITHKIEVRLEQSAQKLADIATEVTRLETLTENSAGQTDKKIQNLNAATQAITAQIEYIADTIAQATNQSETLDRFANNNFKTLQTADAVVEQSIESLQAAVHQVKEDITDEIAIAARVAKDIIDEASEVVVSAPVKQLEAVTKPLIAEPPTASPQNPAPNHNTTQDITFIIEHLHSISMDITRMVEGSVSENTFKDYQSGNIAAFTQYLQALPKILPLGKAKKKYKQDAEFRVFVNRFMQEFEDMRESVEMVAMIPFELQTLYNHLSKIRN